MTTASGQRPDRGADALASAIAEAGVDAELGEPDLAMIEPAAVREAIDEQLAELAAVRRPGAIGSVDVAATRR